MSFKIGDRVAFRAAFLRSISDYSYARASMRGTITSTLEDPLMLVQWDGDGHSSHVNSGNLILASRIHLEPA